MSYRNSYRLPITWDEKGSPEISSEWGIVLAGYVVSGCVVEGAWMLWENSFVVAAIPGAVVVARSCYANSRKTVVSFISFALENDCWGRICWRRSFFSNKFPPKAVPSRRLVFVLVEAHLTVWQIITHLSLWLINAHLISLPINAPARLTRRGRRGPAD